MQHLSAAVGGNLQIVGGLTPLSKWDELERYLNWTSGNRPERHSPQKYKQVDLCALHGHVERIHKVEGVVAL